jgi:RNA polymerase sigma factor (sigma-70 family)
VEASALPAAAELARSRPRLRIGGPLLRLRSDEQLVALFRAGDDEAFRVIHDRYRTRLFAYTRQMLPGSRADAEDVLQDVFVRAYRHLRASDREVLLRPWLYRVAHNRCIDVLRRPSAATGEELDGHGPVGDDPLATLEARDDLQRIVRDVGRLPEAQRSALLMRELDGMPYADIAGALEVTVPAVKSLLVRARISLAQAEEARQTACSEIREHLVLARDRGVRAGGLARRHLHDCSDCRQFQRNLRAVEQRLAMLAPAVGPLALVANILGLGSAGGAASGGGAAGAGGVTALGSSAVAGGAAASAGASVATTAVAAAGSAVAAATAAKVATVAAVAVVAAGHAAPKHHAQPAAQPAPAGAVHRAPAAHRGLGPTPVTKAPAAAAPAAPAAPAAGTPAASDPQATTPEPGTTTTDPASGDGTTTSDGTGTAGTTPPSDSGQPAADGTSSSAPAASTPPGASSSTAPPASGSSPPATSSSTGSTPTASSSSTQTPPAG